MVKVHFINLFSRDSEEITQYIVGYLKYNTLVIHRFIYPSVLSAKYDKMVEIAIDRFEF